MSTQWQKPRQLHERIVVRGWLTLETPTHFGNGDGDGLLDMPLHLDAAEGRALLTGTSLTGALRAYVHRYNTTLAQQLFGKVDNDAENARSEESLVIVDEALGDKPTVELRDGVAIDPQTRTATDEMKFDIQLLAAGSTFPLCFELQLRNNARPELRADLLRGFALALHGLAQGEIRLGKRKRRGFGQCRVTQWQVQRFDMKTPQGLAAWLRYDSAAPSPSVPVANPKDIFALLNIPPVRIPQPACRLDATFRIDGSLLIRSEPLTANAPDFVHLHSVRNGQPTPVLSGSSVAGALRARALRIANTLGKDGYALVDDLFGYRRKGKEDDHDLSASRLWVDETQIEHPLSLVQQRVKIDRFTGGSYPGALFAAQPVFGATETRTHIRLRLDAAQDDRQRDAEIGLLLLLLKDLWTGDLPLGGESSVGRGRLSGERATISIGAVDWTLTADANGGLQINGGTAEALEGYIQSFLHFTPVPKEKQQ
jgi:CRISPR/Cas system CSM-associated protein Csm3 (group 7 of RAMP superfamily)